MALSDVTPTPFIRRLTTFLAMSACLVYASEHAEELKSFEPIITAGDYHSVVLENDRVRVLQVEILPGETVPFHQHGMPSVFVTIEPASLLFRDMSGKAIRVVERSSFTELPHVEWRETPPAPRSVENVDTVPLRALRVEFKE
jgi:quercetin dioxygenase-like cupin family protein